MFRIIATALLLVGIHNFCYSQRYLSPVFSSISVTSNIQYGSANNYRGVSENLLVDFYEPSGDSLSNRPLIIYVHGGGFTDTNQSKNLVHIVAFSDSMARRGYAVACIDYRLDTSISNRAVINAMHDAKAAVRFFKTNYSTYKIDTSLVFIGGESAGAVTALNTSYVDKSPEVLYPPQAPQSTDISVEGNSGSPSSSSSVKATLCFCGGTKTVLNESMFDTLAMENNSNPPLLLVHGTSDPLIPVLNSIHVAKRANHVGLSNLFYPMYGATHCPWFFPLSNSWKYLDTLIDYTVPFLYACVQNSTSLNENQSPSELSVFPNPTNGTLHLSSKGIENEIMNLVISSVDGKTLINRTRKMDQKIIQIDISNLSKGTYILTVFSSEKYFYKKIIVQ